MHSQHLMKKPPPQSASPPGLAWGVAGLVASWSPPDRVVRYRYLYYTTYNDLCSIIYLHRDAQWWRAPRVGARCISVRRCLHWTAATSPPGLAWGVVGWPVAWKPLDRVVGHRQIYYTTWDDLCSIIDLRSLLSILWRRGGAQASRHDDEGPGRHSAPSQRHLPRRVRRGLSPITPCAP